MANAHDLLMAQRAAMMGGKSLPYDAEVEWLGFTGEQFFDTGIRSRHDTFVDVVYKIERPEPYGGILVGSGVFAWGGTGFAYYSETSNSSGMNIVYFGTGGDGNKAARDIATYDWSEFRQIDNTHWYFNNTLRAATDSRGAEIYDTNSNIELGGYRHAGTFTGLVSKFNIVQDGVVVFDTKFVKFTNENGEDEGAMYDRVSGQLFRNAGTGALIVGPDKT